MNSRFVRSLSSILKKSTARLKNELMMMISRHQRSEKEDKRYFLHHHLYWKKIYYALHMYSYIHTHTHRIRRWPVTDVFSLKHVWIIKIDQNHFRWCWSIAMKIFFLTMSDCAWMTRWRRDEWMWSWCIYCISLSLWMMMKLDLKMTTSDNFMLVESVIILHEWLTLDGGERKWERFS